MIRILLEMVGCMICNNSKMLFAGHPTSENLEHSTDFCTENLMGFSLLEIRKPGLGVLGVDLGHAITCCMTWRIPYLNSLGLLVSSMK